MATGTTLTAGSVPYFDKIIIDESGGWAPQEVTPASSTFSARGLENVTKNSNLRWQVQTSWVVKSANAALALHDTVEVTDSGGTGQDEFWIVMDVTETHEFSGRLLQSGTLMRCEYMDTILGA